MLAALRYAFRGGMAASPQEDRLPGD